MTVQDASYICSYTVVIVRYAITVVFNVANRAYRPYFQIQFVTVNINAFHLQTIQISRYLKLIMLKERKSKEQFILYMKNNQLMGKNQRREWKVLHNKNSVLWNNTA